jgi:hypothetical protein
MTTLTAARVELAVAAATASPRGVDSQDRVLAESARTSAAVVVCDGVGSHAGSGAVAELACRLAAGELRDRGVTAVAGLPAVLTGAIADEGLGATTMLALAADDAGEVGFCLLGNGMIVEAAGLPIDETRVRVAWTELALPQVELRGGRPLLASFLPWPGPGAAPAAVGTRRLAAGQTRLFLACSDGIGSEEERSVGIGPDGRLWRPVDPAFAALLDLLGDAWPSLCNDTDVQSELEKILATALASLLAAGQLEDDATVAALLVRSQESRP